jgi:putative ABC transport system ATP-binding protein
MGAGLLLAQKVRMVYRTRAAGVEALWDLDLTIEEGELVATIGPSSSGEMTLLNCPSRLDDIDGGNAIVDGKSLPDMGDAWRSGA